MYEIKANKARNAGRKARCVYLSHELTKRSQQRGLATILSVILVGICLTVLALAMMHMQRSTQEKQIASHAATHAQNSLWAGVEAFRQYLLGLDQTAINGLAGQSHQIELGANYGFIEAQNIAVTDVAGQTRVAATIISRLDTAKSSAIAEVIYSVATGGTCTDCVVLPGMMNFYDDLEVDGHMDFTGTGAGEGLSINVEGTVDISGVDLNSVGQLASTESIYLGFGTVDVDLIHSNEDVVVENTSGIVGEVQSKGDVRISGNSTVTHVKANGNIESNTSGYSDTMNALGNISVGDGTHGTATAGGTLSWTSGGDFTALNAVANITINSAGSGGSVSGEADVDCSSTSWSYSTIEVAGNASNCGGTPAIGQAVNVSLMPPVSDVTMDPFVVDVYKLQGHANYIFTYDSTNSRMLVRVQNINGIADGTYMVGSKDIYDPAYASFKSHLCEVPTTGNACDTLVTPHTPICIHNAPNTECFFYDSGLGQWRLDGASAAPGIMWFEGDVNMNNGTNITTIMATGNIDTGGYFRGYALNYAGFNQVCKAAAPTYPDSFDASVGGKYTAAFSGRYPTNLCDMTANELKPVKAGNIALAAGGYKPPGTLYSGGNIELSASNEVYGTVLAGNAFRTDYGDTHVYGYIVAADLNDSETTTNKLNGSTYIDLSSMPVDFNPAEIPDMSDGTGGAGGGAATGVDLLWSRYR